MSNREKYEKQTEKILLPITERLGLELVDVEYVKEGSQWYLRSYIDKPGGVTIDDCETVSRELSPLLDKEDFIDDAYIMEVSSPGLERPLRKDKDLERSIGKRVRIHTYKNINGEKKFSGTLTGYDNDTISIKEDDAEIIFSRKDISLIHLEVEW